MSRSVACSIVWVALCGFPFALGWAQENAKDQGAGKAKAPERVAISVLAFDEMVNDTARTCESLAMNGKQLGAKERQELRIAVPIRVLKLWIDVVPELEA